jgi:hypothetical protein
MSRPPSATVDELEKYWAYIRTLKDGDELEWSIETNQMPHWEDICSKLLKVNDTIPEAVRNRYVERVRRQRYGHEGVYRIIGLTADHDTEKPATIKRLHGRDTTGTLYIGQAGNLYQRLDQFQRSVRIRFSRGHMAGVWWQQCWLLSEMFPPARLAFATMRTPVGTSEGTEFDLIRAYLNSFGDTPPLNCSF